MCDSLSPLSLSSDCSLCSQQDFQTLRNRLEDQWGKLIDPSQFQSKLLELQAQFDMQVSQKNVNGVCVCVCVCVCVNV